MTYHIPPEIIDVIVNEVAQNKDDPTWISTLAACTLTSWSLATPARKGLWRQITLVEDEGIVADPKSQKRRSRLERFLRLIEHGEPCVSNSHRLVVTTLIKSIKIVLSGIRALHNMHVSHQMARTSDQQPSLLPLILDSIPNGHELDLGFRIHAAYHSWMFIDKSLKERVLHFCVSRPIRSMQLSHINRTTPALISASPLLNFLTLRFTELDSLCSHIPQVLDKLAYLRLDGGPGLRDISNTSLLLKLGAFRQLATLEIHWTFGNVSEGVGGLLHWINLQYSDKPTKLAIIPVHTLIIVGDWTTRTKTTARRHFSPLASWKSLDELLSIDRFPNLCTLKFDLTVYCEVGPKFSIKNIQKTVQQLLPSVSASQRISITFDVHCELLEETGDNL